MTRGDLWEVPSVESIKRDLTGMGFQPKTSKPLNSKTNTQQTSQTDLPTGQRFTLIHVYDLVNIHGWE